MNRMTSKIHVYILHLEGGRYYVGKTTTLDKRLEQYFSGQGSAWTELHPPTGKVELLWNVDSWEEDKQTLLLMKQHGVEKVRGGTFASVVLAGETTTVIEAMLKSESDKCYLCGEHGHQARACPSKAAGTVHTTPVSVATSPAAAPAVKVVAKITQSNCSVCHRRWGMFSEYPSETCPWCTEQVCKQREQKELVCALCGRNTHRHDKCFAKQTLSGAPIAPYLSLVKYEEATKNCGRCGRNTHKSSKCHALTDINGGALCRI